MRAIDEEAQALINDVLRQAGWLAVDGDAEALKGYAIRQYLRYTLDKVKPNRDALSRNLIRLIMIRRHRGWLYEQDVPVMHSQQLSGRYEWLEVTPGTHRDLAHHVQLTPNERDVLYLLVAAGMSQDEIVEKLGASGDWVEVTIAKIKQIYGPFWKQWYARRTS